MQQSDLIDPALVAEVDLARAAAQEEAGDERVGDYVEYQIEDSAAVTHLFEADKPGYRGWRWAVTITSAGPDSDVTVSEVVLLPGPTALVAPEWIPWQQRVQAGDLGVGDLLPTSPDDPRLVPAYVASDDPAVEEVAAEAGLGRVRVMSRPARLDAADRWQQSDFGPRSDMARSAPAHCGTCGFYLPLAGSLRAAFGTCGNEFAPADGHVVHVEYGCGAHSEAEVEQVSPVLVADLIYDDAQLDVEPLVVVDEVVTPEADSSADVALVEPGEVESDESVAAEQSSASEEPAEAESGVAAVGGVSDESESPVAVETASDVISAEPDEAGSGESGVEEASTEAASTESGEAGAGESEAVGEASEKFESPAVVDTASEVTLAEPAEAESGLAAVGDVSEESESPAADETASDVTLAESGEAGTGESGVGEASADAASGPAESGVAAVGDVSDESQSPASAEIASDVTSVASGESVASAESGAAAAGDVADESESPASAEAASDGEPGEPESSAPAETASEEEPAPAEPDAVPSVDEAPIAGASAVEDAAPAAIEPVVTGETSQTDEPASRE